MAKQRVYMWALKWPGGNIDWRSLRLSRKSLLREAPTLGMTAEERWGRTHEQCWPRMYRKGFRIVKVRVQEI